MVEQDNERYGHLDSWSRELGIPVRILSERLKRVRGITGRTHDGQVLEEGFYKEEDLRRVCADLLPRKKSL